MAVYSSPKGKTLGFDSRTPCQQKSPRWRFFVMLGVYYYEGKVMSNPEFTSADHRDRPKAINFKDVFDQRLTEAPEFPGEQGRTYSSLNGLEEFGIDWVKRVVSAVVIKVAPKAESEQVANEIWLATGMIGPGRLLLHIEVANELRDYLEPTDMNMVGDFESALLFQDDSGDLYLQISNLSGKLTREDLGQENDGSNPLRGIERLENLIRTYNLKAIIGE